MRTDSTTDMNVTTDYGQAVLARSAETGAPVPRPPQRPLCPAALYPTGVIYSRGSRVTVGIEFGPDDRYATEYADDSIDQTQAALMAIGDLADIARSREERIQVGVDSQEIAHLTRWAIAGDGDAYLEIARCSTSQMVRLFSAIVESHRYDQETDPAGEGGAGPADLPRLIVGTDGSSDRRRGTWAWVSDEGKHDAGRSRSSLIDVCELEAIVRALGAAGKRDLLVLTDSRPALSELRSGGSTRNKAELVARVRRLIAERQAGGHSTEIAWVRGHAGVGLNEIADRLAVYARRVAAFGISREVAEKAIRGILADLDGHSVPPRDARWVVTDQDLAECSFAALAG